MYGLRRNYVSRFSLFRKFCLLDGPFSVGIDIKIKKKYRGIWFDKYFPEINIFKQIKLNTDDKRKI